MLGCKKMRIGLIARNDFTGLSVQTKAFWKHINPVKTLVVDLSRYSKASPSLSDFTNCNVQLWDDEIYPSLDCVQDSIIEDFLKDIDIVFTCETPYNYWLFERARQLGIKTVLQYNYEFLDYGNGYDLPEPDLFLAPSLWHLDDVKTQLPGRNIAYLPVPVDREDFPFQLRTCLKSLLHTVGTGTGEDRNGTDAAIAAMSNVSDVDLTIRSQYYLNKWGNNINIIVGKAPSPSELYQAEDCYLMPRKFGGLCLPFHEALSCGMPILVSDCSPQIHWVPDELRIKCHKTKSLQTRKLLDVWECDPIDIADKINWLKNSPNKVKEYSLWADEYAESISWSRMKKKYLETFTNI